MADVRVTIDGHEISVPANTTILKAAEKIDIHIPSLCAHPALKPIGACRICLVEVEKQRTLQPACTYPVTEGMVVHTDTPNVHNSRRFVLELLLSDHPLDCMTCEATGSCELQDLAYAYGIKDSRYPGNKERYEIDSSNPFIERDMNKCILCRRCVRACDEINGVEAIIPINRGYNTVIGTAYDRPLQDSVCEACGMCVEVCPTGSLIDKAAVGKGRVWQTHKVPTICPYCGVGCTIDLNVRDNHVVKATSNWDGAANKGWLCVKGHYGWEFVEHKDRLTTPLIRKEGKMVEATWDEALDLVADRFVEIAQKHGPDALAFLASAKCTNEENYLVQKMARGLFGTNNIDHCARL
jgi:formate dehydrogenase alpha subunit